MYKVMKIYYDKATGEVLYAASYSQTTTVNFEHDYSVIIDLKNRTKESISLLTLTDGQYAQDFAECSGYRVNPTTKKLEFAYPDPNAPVPSEPVYQKPLTEQINELEAKQALMQKALDDMILGGAV